MTDGREPKAIVARERETRMGHIPASRRVCARDKRKNPMATPDTSAMPMPGGRRSPATAPACDASGALCWLTRTIATMPRRMPSAGDRRGPLAEPDRHQDRNGDGAHRGGRRYDRHAPDGERAIEERDAHAAGEPRRRAQSRSAREGAWRS